jgi:hypothetical protein
LTARREQERQSPPGREGKKSGERTVGLLRLALLSSSSTLSLLLLTTLDLSLTSGLVLRLLLSHLGELGAELGRGVLGLGLAEDDVALGSGAVEAGEGEWEDAKREKRGKRRTT